MDSIKKFSDLEHIENNPKDVVIDFDKFPKININAKEIYNSRITGCFSDSKGTFHGNIVLSSLNKFVSQKTNLSRVDWKDSNLRDCRFIATSFDFGAFINCHVSNCHFQYCHYENVSITGTTLYEVEFLNCDLSQMVIENCYFYCCKFTNCKTSNKVFEQCLLIDCIFVNTDIQLDTIIENFGLEKVQFINSNIRDKSTDENYTLLEIKDLQNICLKNKTLQNIYKFKVEFFLKPEIIVEGSVLFDSIFRVSEWLVLCKSKTTFLNMFKLFHDFFIILFERNELPLFAIHKFKELIIWLSDKPEIKNNYELYPAIIGYDIGLSRLLSQSNQIIEGYQKHIEDKLTLLVEGPLSSDYYYNILTPFINGSFKITKIVKQNSPNLMDIVAVSTVIIQIIALFINTRVKVELVNNKNNKRKSKRKSKNKKFDEAITVYNIIDHAESSSDILKKYYTNPPVSYFVFNNYSSKDFGKIRKIIKNIHK